MIDKKIIKEGYISDLDLFLRKFDQSHPDCGAARLAEVKKAKDIAAKRDGVVEKKQSGLWEKF